MIEFIEPALTPEEWAAVLAHPEAPFAWIEQTGDRPHAAIALRNFMLPDSDPRKITRERIAALRSAADVVYDAMQDAEEGGRGRVPGSEDALRSLYAQASAIADALESYLPPE